MALGTIASSVSIATRSFAPFGNKPTFPFSQSFTLALVVEALLAAIEVPCKS